jgi:hypothetical protein
VIGAGADFLQVFDGGLAIFVLFARDFQKMTAVDELDVEDAAVTMDGDIDFGAQGVHGLNADAMETLQILAAFYGHLPQAHQDLAEGLTHPANPQKALTELASFADQVSRRTQALEKSR